VSINEFPDDQAQTEIEAKFTAYSAESNQIFQSILENHPKLRPKKLENTHHIWCLESDIGPDKGVSVDDLKPIADHISKALDIPVSVFADQKMFSLAIFWDSRKLGTGKFFDYEVH
jgi:hypothetical protein